MRRGKNDAARNPRVRIFFSALSHGDDALPRIGKKRFRPLRALSLAPPPFAEGGHKPLERSLLPFHFLNRMEECCGRFRRPKKEKSLRRSGLPKQAQSKLKTEPRQDSPFQDRPAVVRFAGRFATVPFLLLPILGWACGPAPGCAGNPAPFDGVLGSRRYWIGHRPPARPFRRGR